MRFYRILGILSLSIVISLSLFFLWSGLFTASVKNGIQSHTLSERTRDRLQQERSEVIRQQVLLSQDSDIATRSEFQRQQIKKYCAEQSMHHHLYQWPKGKGQPDDIYRHILFDDARESLFCFVEKNGCTNMKRLMFVSVGQLSVHSSQDEWVDLKYLEQGIRHASFLNKSLTEEGRLSRLKNYYKFTIVRNPLERLVSSYRNKIEPPLSGNSIKFPNYLKREIFEQSRPIVYHHWLESGGSYNISITFPEFVEYYISSFKDHVNPHIRPFTKICHPCNVPYDFYGEFSHYSRDVKMIIDKVGMKLEHYRDSSLHVRTDFTNSLMDKYYWKLTLLQRARLYDAMREELLFYYHLYPGEREEHVRFLGINEQLYNPKR